MFTHPWWSQADLQVAAFAEVWCSLQTDFCHLNRHEWYLMNLFKKKPQKTKTINNHINNKRANKHQLVVFVFIDEKKTNNRIL